MAKNRLTAEETWQKWVEDAKKNPEKPQFNGGDAPLNAPRYDKWNRQKKPGPYIAAGITMFVIGVFTLFGDYENGIGLGLLCCAVGLILAVYGIRYAVTTDWAAPCMQSELRYGVVWCIDHNQPREKCQTRDK